MVSENLQRGSRFIKARRALSDIDTNSPATLESHDGFTLHDLLPADPDDLSLGVHLQYVPLDEDGPIQEITVYTNNISAARRNKDVPSFLRSLQGIRDTPSPSMKTFEATTKDLVHRNEVSKSGFSAHLLNGAQSVAAERSAGIGTICLGDFNAESERYKSPKSAVATVATPGEISDSGSDDMMTGFEKRRLDEEVDGCLYAL
jgi:hypothetical protein